MNASSFTSVYRSKTTVFALAALCLMSVLCSISQAAAGDCMKDQLVLYIKQAAPLEASSPQTRRLFDILSAYLAEFQDSSIESFVFSAGEVTAPSPWYRPLSGATRVGSVIAAGLASSQCSEHLSDHSLMGAARRLRADLDRAGFSYVTVIPFSGADLRSRVTCSPHWYTYELTSQRGREPHSSQWESCQRPGTLIGSSSSMSDGSKVRFMVTNPFEVEGWCQTEADMEQERRRLERECPGVAQVSLYLKPLSGLRAVDLFGNDYFLRLR